MENERNVREKKLYVIIVRPLSPLVLKDSFFVWYEKSLTIVVTYDRTYEPKDNTLIHMGLFRMISIPFVASTGNKLNVFPLLTHIFMAFCYKEQKNEIIIRILGVEIIRFNFNLKHIHIPYIYDKEFKFLCDTINLHMNM